LADLSIAITTKNRWDALQVSLSKLAEHLPEADVMVVDDGSDSPCPYDMSALHPRLQLKVHAASGGLVVRRNELIRNASTPYVMSLDDDSFPSDSNVYGAVELLRSSPEVLCVSLPIYNPPTGLFQNAARQVSRRSAGPLWVVDM
jgi:glycosyltransferase involved in cell wall biosynthesis